MSPYLPDLERDLRAAIRSGAHRTERPAPRRVRRLGSVLALSAGAVVAIAVVAIAFVVAGPSRQARPGPVRPAVSVGAGDQAFAAFRRRRTASDVLPQGMLRLGAPVGLKLDQSRQVFVSRETTLWLVPGSAAGAKLCLLQAESFGSAGTAGLGCHGNPRAPFIGGGGGVGTATRATRRNHPRPPRHPTLGTTIVAVVPVRITGIRVVLTNGTSFVLRPNADGAIVHTFATAISHTQFITPAVRTVSPPVPATRCVSSQLRLSHGPSVSEKTEQATQSFIVRNIAATPCAMQGYPTITLRDARGTTLPFTYRRHGDEMLTDARPAPVTFPPGDAGYFAINKNACVAHASHLATSIIVTLPGSQNLPALKASADYCGASDPGHVIDITPIEHSAADLWAQAPTNPRTVVQPLTARTSPCRASQLTISRGHSLAAGGTAGAYITFTNRTSTACALHGWPTLIARTAGGRRSTATHARSTMFGPNVTGVPTVVIEPGHHADAVFTNPDHGITGRGNCPSYRTLQITPPGNTQSTVISAWIPYLGHDLPACFTPDVSMVVPPADLYKG